MTKPRYHKHLGVRMNKSIADRVDQRVRELKLKGKQQFFMHLLVLDGYQIKPNDV